jgi:hypothetical protein
LPVAFFLLGSLFDPENAIIMFYKNVAEVLPGYEE